MRILILTHAEVEQLLPPAECIAVMAAALTALARGQMYQPLRTVVRPPGAAGLVALMPAYRGGERPSFGLKAVGVFPGNAALGVDTHQGGVLLFNGGTGEPLALMNGAAITAIRTAAVSGVATRLLAREDAGELAILGAGVQARSHLQAMAAVRVLRRCRVAGRRPGSAQKFAAEMGPHFPFPVQAAENAQAAARGADIIVTATDAAAPVLRREWVSPGAHINAVGSSTPTTRELDTATVAGASLFVDRRESTLNEAGDYLIPVQEGAFGPDHIRAEIGELLLGAHPGRTSPDEITLFKSLGLAVEDLACAEHLYRQAQARNAGAWVDF